MTDIILYAFGVMYTPGPVNAIGLNNGIQQQKTLFGFFAGVAVAMFILLTVIGVIGENIIDNRWLLFTSILGSLYIAYLAIKIWRSAVGHAQQQLAKPLTFRDGLLMQLLNPKSFTVALPLATVQFPSLGITGVALLAWCLGLAIFAFGAPWIYFVVGRRLGQRVQQLNMLNLINKVMALFLFFVAIKMSISSFI
ncbi:LysE family transporter [Vibrio tritonius]|uniref:LysE family transporter n=1 Tax=Vibrio tritonius TaxID=1435069 RepID=A0ABS7YWX8_9VIBR|nr:LysE family transporter [Vibrio tritonius]MCA2018830.1 LysE family transporter [Vibrio tritonius]